MKIKLIDNFKKQHLQLETILYKCKLYFCCMTGMDPLLPRWREQHFKVYDHSQDCKVISSSSPNLPVNQASEWDHLDNPIFQGKIL